MQRGTGKESTQSLPGRVEWRLEFRRTIQDAGSRVMPFPELRETGGKSTKSRWRSRVPSQREDTAPPEGSSQTLMLNTAGRILAHPLTACISLKPATHLPSLSFLIYKVRELIPTLQCAAWGRDNRDTLSGTDLTLDSRCHQLRSEVFEGMAGKEDDIQLRPNPALKLTPPWEAPGRVLAPTSEYKYL